MIIKELKKNIEEDLFFLKKELYKELKDKIKEDLNNNEKIYLVNLKGSEYSADYVNSKTYYNYLDYEFVMDFVNEISFNPFNKIGSEEEINENKKEELGLGQTYLDELIKKIEKIKSNSKKILIKKYELVNKKEQIESIVDNYYGNLLNDILKLNIEDFINYDLWEKRKKEGLINAEPRGSIEYSIMDLLLENLNKKEVFLLEGGVNFQQININPIADNLYHENNNINDFLEYMLIDRINSNHLREYMEEEKIKNIIIIKEITNYKNKNSKHCIEKVYAYIFNNSYIEIFKKNELQEFCYGLLPNNISDESIFYEKEIDL